jgi:hypothetical protein
MDEKIYNKFIINPSSREITGDLPEFLFTLHQSYPAINFFESSRNLGIFLTVNGK